MGENGNPGPVDALEVFAEDIRVLRGKTDGAKLHPLQKSTHPLARGPFWDEWQRQEQKKQAAEFRKKPPPEYLEHRAKQKWLGKVWTPMDLYGM